MTPIGKTILLAFATLSLLAPLSAADGHGGEECFQTPSYAEITSLQSTTTTIQLAGNTWTVPLSAGQALVFSLDGGFWVDVDYHCIEVFEVRVWKDGSLAQDSWYDAGCGSGEHHEWVPMGLEVSEVRIELNWWGCDRLRGGSEAGGVVTDPPVF